MAELGRVTWPPGPIATDRLLLRPPAARDRAAFVDLYTSPDVGAFTGGARSREAVERALPAAPQERPGHFAIDLDGAMVGTVQLERRDVDYEVRLAAGHVDLGYLLLPEAWGRGYASEAAKAMVQAGFERLKVERIYAVCEVAHCASARVLEKVGLRWVRTEIRYYEAKGRWWDMELYELWRAEWEANR